MPASCGSSSHASQDRRGLIISAGETARRRKRATMAVATSSLAGQQSPARARFPLASTPGTRGRVRLRTLSNLRWMAIAGQSAALFIVYFGFGYRLPLGYCVAAIAISALLNVTLSLRYPASHRLNSRQATLYLGYDTLQLAALLYLTGGLENPFALMVVAPVVVAAGTLELANTLLLGVLAFISISTIAIVHKPLPWSSASIDLPALYQAGIWASLVIGISFTS